MRKWGPIYSECSGDTLKFWELRAGSQGISLPESTMMIPVIACIMDV